MYVTLFRYGGASTNSSVNAQVTGEKDAALRLERMRVQEALSARDVAIDRLADACASVREKTDALSTLREEKDELQRELDACLKDNRADKENLNSDNPTDSLAAAVKDVEDRLAALRMADGHGVSAGVKVRCSVHPPVYTTDVAGRLSIARSS